MATKKRTLQAYESTKNMSDEDRAFLDKIITEFITTYRKKNINTLTQRLYRLRGGHIDSDVVESQIQDLYVWMYTHSEVTLSFYNKCGGMSGLMKLINLLIFNLKSIKTCMNELDKSNHFEMYEEIKEYEEDPPHYTNDALNPRLPLEERLEAHRIALEETKAWLLDNPQSKTAKALEILRDTTHNSGYSPNAKEDYYKVCLNYIATPSRIFLYDNADRLGLIKSHYPVNKFKKICSEIWGKKIQKNAIVPWAV